MYNNNLHDIDMVMEEAGELIVALNKLKRNLTNDPTVRVSMEDAFNGVIEEIADVRCTINRLIEVFDLDERKIVNIIIDKKRRTQELLKHLSTRGVEVLDE